MLLNNMNFKVPTLEAVLTPCSYGRWSTLGSHSSIRSVDYSFLLDILSSFGFRAQHSWFSSSRIPNTFAYFYTHSLWDIIQSQDSSVPSKLNTVGLLQHPKFSLPPRPLQELQTSILNFLLYISMWVSSRCRKHNLPQTEFLTFSPFSPSTDIQSQLMATPCRLYLALHLCITHDFFFPVSQIHQAFFLRTLVFSLSVLEILFPEYRDYSVLCKT